MALAYTFTNDLWLYPGDGAWYFITLPTEYGKEIKSLTNSIKRGFGSLKVVAAIGTTLWHTSIFPDSKTSSYLLPVKKEIRAKNNLKDGQKVTVTIEIVGII